MIVPELARAGPSRPALAERHSQAVDRGPVALARAAAARGSRVPEPQRGPGAALALALSDHDDRRPRCPQPSGPALVSTGSGRRVPSLLGRTPPLARPYSVCVCAWGGGGCGRARACVCTCGASCATGLHVSISKRSRECARSCERSAVPWESRKSAGTGLIARACQTEPDRCSCRRARPSGAICWRSLFRPSKKAA
jgi:hypothetical protein